MASITKREIEVLELIAQGLTTKEIAVILNRSIETIRSHKKHLLQKISAKNCIELILKANQEKLIELK